MTTRAGENRGADWGGRHARGRGFRPGGTDAETSARAGRDIGTRHGGRCRHARRETAKGRISAAFHLQHACAARQRREVPQRWRALKRGLLLQITKPLPRARTTLHSRLRAFTASRETRTFLPYI